MSNDDNEYTPVSCELHSNFELAIIHRTSLKMHWRDETGMSHLGQVIPVDLKTANHQEYLIVTDSEQNRVEMRLDRIVTVESEDEQW